MKDWSNWRDEWDDLARDPQEITSYGAGLHPGIKSALIVSGIVLVISVINALTAGTSVIFCYPVQLIIYGCNGWLGAYFALNSGYSKESLLRVGATAGAVAWILPAAFYVIGSLVLGLFTFGIGFLGTAMLLLCGPVDLAIHVLCAMFGAWLHGRNATPNDPYPY